MVDNNNNNNNTQLLEHRGAINSEALADRSSRLGRNGREKMSFKSIFIEFQTDGAAMLKEHLPIQFYFKTNRQTAVSEQIRWIIKAI